MQAYLPQTSGMISSEALPPESVVALGVFDGVHLGHQALLAAARALADSQKLPLLVLSFFATNKTGGMLTTPETRNRLFAEAGADYAVFYEFAELSHLSPETFVAQILRGVHGCRGAVCGTDFRFGNGRAGNAETLRALLSPYPVQVVSPVCTAEGDAISSSRIRGLLAEGNVEAAHRLLGRPYTLYGAVRHGRGDGKKMGSPTANLAYPPAAQLPAHGVYATHVTIDGTVYPAVTNVGKNPTVVEDGAVTCESFLLAQVGNLYEKDIAVSFLCKLRNEQKFPSVSALTAQIAEDVAAAHAFFARIK